MELLLQRDRVSLVPAAWVVNPPPPPRLIDSLRCGGLAVASFWPSWCPGSHAYRSRPPVAMRLFPCPKRISLMWVDDNRA